MPKGYPTPREVSCDICSIKYVTTNFKRGRDGRRRCYDCQKDRDRKCNNDSRKLGKLLNPNYQRTDLLWSKYRITLGDYEDILEEQHGVCAICKGPPIAGKCVFDVDHDHKTLVVRGLLCTDCNNILGRAKDSTVILQSAIEYLKKHGVTT